MKEIHDIHEPNTPVADCFRYPWLSTYTSYCCSLFLIEAPWQSGTQYGNKFTIQKQKWRWNNCTNHRLCIFKYRDHIFFKHINVMYQPLQWFPCFSVWVLFEKKKNRNSCLICNSYLLLCPSHIKMDESIAASKPPLVLKIPFFL